MSKIVHPLYYQIYQREGASWFVKEGGRVFYNPTSAPTQLEHIELQFGLTEIEIIIELFRVNGGKPGYYLANLRDRKYHYCGLKWSDIRKTLIDLGIGRLDPVES